MAGGGKGGETSTSSTTTSMPPEWAEPALKLAASDAMRFYQNGRGFNTYMGPTQAPLSAETLGSMNGILQATGSNSRPWTNERINHLVPVLNMDMMKTAGYRRKANMDSKAAGQGGNGQGGQSGYYNGPFGYIDGNNPLPAAPGSDEYDQAWKQQMGAGYNPTTGRPLWATGKKGGKR